MSHRRNALPLRLLAGALLLAAAPLALAQYVWIDDKGVKQLSDRPPPPNVPDKRILKAPGKPLFNPNAAPEAEAPPPAADSAEPATKRPPTLAERNADFNKRKAEAAAAEKKAGEEARRQASAAANCDAARKNQLAVDQGIRISTFDKNGERGVMSDEQREDLRKKSQKVLADCK
jgi:type IV secretory pathway VirB10-like protein